MIASISSVTPVIGAYHMPSSSSAKEGSSDNSRLKPTTPDAVNDKNSLQLSETDQKIVQQLKKRDTEVRAHELAHLAAAAGIARSGANFSYQQGPDGVRYAVGGEVNIDTSAVAGNPAATLRKADIIKSAAMAPAQPSAQDLQVASSATAMASKAITELLASTQKAGKNPLGSLLDVSA